MGFTLPNKSQIQKLLDLELHDSKTLLHATFLRKAETANHLRGSSKYTQALCYARLD
jgi:hypothetical protein